MCRSRSLTRGTCRGQDLKAWRTQSQHTQQDNPKQLELQGSSDGIWSSHCEVSWQALEQAARIGAGGRGVPQRAAAGARPRRAARLAGRAAAPAAAPLAPRPQCQGWCPCESRTAEASPAEGSHGGQPGVLLLSAPQMCDRFEDSGDHLTESQCAKLKPLERAGIATRAHHKPTTGLRTVTN